MEVFVCVEVMVYRYVCTQTAFLSDEVLMCPCPCMYLPYSRAWLPSQRLGNDIEGRWRLPCALVINLPAFHQTLPPKTTTTKHQRGHSESLQ